MHALHHVYGEKNVIFIIHHLSTCEYLGRLFAKLYNSSFYLKAIRLFLIIKACLRNITNLDSMNIINQLDEIRALRELTAFINIG